MLPCPTNHHFQPESLRISIAIVIVCRINNPKFIEISSAMQSSDTVKSFLSQKIYTTVVFLLLSFLLHTFLWACRSLHESQKFYFQTPILYIHLFVTHFFMDFSQICISTSPMYALRGGSRGSLGSRDPPPEKYQRSQV